MKGSSIVINCNGDSYEIEVSNNMRLKTQLVIVRKYRIDIHENKPDVYFSFDYLDYNMDQLESIVRKMIVQKKKSFYEGVANNQKMLQNALGLGENEDG